jgi:ribosomal protein S27E
MQTTATPLNPFPEATAVLVDVRCPHCQTTCNVAVRRVDGKLACSACGDTLDERRPEGWRIR